MRHPSFLGLREDKAAKDVKSDMQKRTEAMDTGPSESNSDTILGVKLTHPDRVIFDGQGATKRDVAAYMAEIAPRMLPHIKDHPVSLVRCPSGASGQCFFQKHFTESTPDQMTETRIQESGGKSASYLLLNSAEALVSAAQIGALELHIWGARADMLEKPDRFVIDLDPDEGLSFDDVKTAALEVRGVLQSAGLESFPLLTGGKGIHVVAPLERRREWPDIKAAARGLARRMEEADPARYVSEMSKKKRKGKIFIDWLRNERGATAVCPYSLRARPGAPVATPVRWDELTSLKAANTYTLANIRQRLSKLKADPWEGYGQTRQSISNAVLALLTGNA